MTSLVLEHGVERRKGCRVDLNLDSWSTRHGNERVVNLRRVRSHRRLAVVCGQLLNPLGAVLEVVFADRRQVRLVGTARRRPNDAAVAGLLASKLALLVRVQSAGDGEDVRVGLRLDG